ncbi:hypothetical protein COO60DRAFT_1522188 [Scenedesmus sp. NREL 46B-D3]|nr:hypothetical protein COO60DRAFT_1522188 [Scenedesmus sp. NREL 46B-D3]
MTAAAAAAAGVAAPMVCAVADALELMSSAGVELLTASLKCGGLMAPAQQRPQQQQPGEVSKHVVCSHWLAQQWLAAATSRAGNVGDGQQGIGCVQGVAGGVARLPAVAKRLLLAVTACIKLLRKE